MLAELGLVLATARCSGSVTVMALAMALWYSRSHLRNRLSELAAMEIVDQYRKMINSFDWQ